MSSDPVIEVRGLSKIYQIYDSPRHRLRQMLSFSGRQHFREFAALRDLSLTVHRGETLGVIGRNGAGKSTLLQLICGTLSPSKGSVTVRGRVAALLELGAGFNPDFSGRENVFIAAAIYGLTRFDIEARIESILEFAGIGEFVDQPVKNYSSGMFVRLAFAVIAHVDADVLVVDEALAVGDIFFQQKCMRFLRNFQANGGTMLFVSHDTSAVINLCSSALWLRAPALSDYLMGPSEDVCKAYLKDFYVQQEAALQILPAKAAPLDELVHGLSGCVVVECVPDAPVENLIDLSAFNTGAESFGAGGASFVDAFFVDATGQKTRSVQAEQPVALRLVARMRKQVEFPAFGITIKDRLGQFVISEGTDGAFRSSNLVFKPGEIVTVEFRFRMPVLLQGIYSLDIALAEGLGHEHIQHHWIHDAITITSLKGRLVQGIVGLPDLSVAMNRQSS
jgi:lipopolysaccharide transport system ATP-binding protein